MGITVRPSSHKSIFAGWSNAILPYKYIEHVRFVAMKLCGADKSILKLAVSERHLQHPFFRICLSSSLEFSLATIYLFLKFA